MHQKVPSLLIFLTVVSSMPVLPVGQRQKQDIRTNTIFHSTPIVDMRLQMTDCCSACQVGWLPFESPFLLCWSKVDKPAGRLSNSSLGREEINVFFSSQIQLDHIALACSSWLVVYCLVTVSWLKSRKASSRVTELNSGLLLWLRAAAKAERDCCCSLGCC